MYLKLGGIVFNIVYNIRKWYSMSLLLIVYCVNLWDIIIKKKFWSGFIFVLK